jgi:hypothetical protein
MYMWRSSTAFMGRDSGLAIIGPDKSPLGERDEVPDITQSPIATTLVAFVGENPLLIRSEAAAVAMGEVLGVPGLLPACNRVASLVDTHGMRS